MLDDSLKLTERKEKEKEEEIGKERGGGNTDEKEEENTDEKRRAKRRLHGSLAILRVSSRQRLSFLCFIIVENRRERRYKHYHGA